MWPTLTLREYCVWSALIAAAQGGALALMAARGKRDAAGGAPAAVFVARVRRLAGSFALTQLVLFFLWGRAAPGAGFLLRQAPYVWFLAVLLVQVQSQFRAEKDLRGLEAGTGEHLLASARSMLTSAARTWIGLYILATAAARWAGALRGWPSADGHFEVLFGAGYGVLVLALILADIVLAPRLLRLSASCSRLEGDRAEGLAARFERAGLRRPEVWAIALERIGGHNAMVTGLRAPWEILSPELFVTKSLVERFPPEELDAVVAHEIAHVKLRHVALRCALSGAFLFAPPMALLWCLKWYGGGAGLTPLQSSLAFFAGWMAHNLALNALSRSQELEADAYAVTVLGVPLEAMTGALRRLTELNDQLEKSPDAASHPDLASREAELRRRTAGPAAPDRRARLAGLAFCVLAAALALPFDYHFRLRPQHELCLAAGRGDIPALEKWAGGDIFLDDKTRLVRTGPLDIEDPLGGGPPIVWAYSGRRREALNWLFLHGADPAPNYTRGRIPLHVFSHVGDEDAVVGMLKLTRAEVNERDDDGRTPLFDAVRSSAVAAALLDAGADINAADKWGNTPLTMAVEDYDRASVEVARLLLRRGARTDARNEDGMTAAEIAEAYGGADKTALFPSKDGRLGGPARRTKK